MTDLILEAMTRARNQIARPGYFFKGNYYKKSDLDTGLDFPCCIYGAVGYGVDYHPRNFTTGDLSRQIITLLRLQIPTRLKHVSLLRELSLIKYGDRIATTQDDVVALFDRAIEKRKKAL